MELLDHLLGVVRTRDEIQTMAAKGHVYATLVRLQCRGPRFTAALEQHRDVALAEAHRRGLAPAWMTGEERRQRPTAGGADALDA